VQVAGAKQQCVLFVIGFSLSKEAEKVQRSNAEPNLNFYSGSGSVDGRIKHRVQVQCSGQKALNLNQTEPEHH
jgi:hypothetical protein